MIKYCLNQSIIGPDELWIDIGCGTGNWIKTMSSCIDCQMIGVDPSFAMLKVAQEKMVDEKWEKVQLIQVAEPFLRLPLRNKSVDGVFSNLAFHHVKRYLHWEAIKEMMRVVKIGGRIVIADIMFRNEGDLTRRIEEFPEEMEKEEFLFLDNLRRLDVGMEGHVTQRKIGGDAWAVEIKK
jgi:putative AdoMet-dependent methyltransferase